MIPFVRKKALSAALIGFGFVPSVALAGPFEAKRPTPPAAKSTPTKDEQLVIVREPGKPDRHCVLVGVVDNPDGSKTFRVKAKDNGQVLTIHQKGQMTKLEGSALDPTADIKPTGASTTMPPRKLSAEPIAMPSLNEPPPAFPVAEPVQADIKPMPLPAVDPVETPSPELTLPGMKNRSADPLLMPPTAETIKVPGSIKTVPAEKSQPPRSGGLFRRLFSKEMTGLSESGCAECAMAQAHAVAVPGSSGLTVGTPAEPPMMPQVEKGIATIHPEPVAAAKPGRSEINEAPRPTASMIMTPPPAVEPVSIIAGAAPSPVATPDQEAVKFLELKQELASALRPTQRMAAADGLLAIAPGRVQEVRELLMTAAQDDPAGCVRAAALQALSRLRTRSESFKTLLDVAQEDEDPEVREIVKYALNKLGVK